MGIRAIGIIPDADYESDSASFLRKLRKDLCQLGAFGFESWKLTIKTGERGNQVNERKDQSNDPLITIIHFTDAPNQIIAANSNDPDYSLFRLVVGDSSFLPLLQDLQIKAEDERFKVEGHMVQLGDFKIRFGTALYGKGYMKIGILIDIEYLPTVLLSNDYTNLFKSVCQLMNLEIQNLYLPPVITEPLTEFTYADLGKLYLDFLKNTNT